MGVAIGSLRDGVDRRSVVRATAWSGPIVAFAVAAPAVSASMQGTIRISLVMPAFVEADSSFYLSVVVDVSDQFVGTVPGPLILELKLPPDLVRVDRIGVPAGYPFIWVTGGVDGTSTWLEFSDISTDSVGTYRMLIYTTAFEENHLGVTFPALRVDPPLQLVSNGRADFLADALVIEKITVITRQPVRSGKEFTIAVGGHSVSYGAINPGTIIEIDTPEEFFGRSVRANDAGAAVSIADGVTRVVLPASGGSSFGVVLTYVCPAQSAPTDTTTRILSATNPTQVVVRKDVPVDISFAP